MLRRKRRVEVDVKVMDKRSGISLMNGFFFLLCCFSRVGFRGGDFEACCGSRKRNLLAR